MSDTGILLSNLGTPDTPSPASLRKYLAEFLRDPRVVEIPRLLWLPLLYGVILPLRSRQSAKLYQKIWTPEGSPLRVILAEQAQKLQALLGSRATVSGAMRYGNPSLEKALLQFNTQKIKKLILLPLYPQYSASTTASTFDEVARVFKTLRVQPELHVINSYFNHSKYIKIIANNINIKYQKLLFSFHGLPQKFTQKGDPYEYQCHETARLIAAELKLTSDQWLISFQSRLGRAEWLKPYTEETLKQLPLKGIKSVAVVCPGFSADCLETLEEINHYNREVFIKAGGEIFEYIPALNAQDNHIAFMAELVKEYL